MRTWITILAGVMAITTTPRDANAQYVYYQTQWTVPMVTPIAQPVMAPTTMMMAAPMAAPVVYTPAPAMSLPAPVNNTPVGRLQSALTILGFFQCPITGEWSDTTRRALSRFLIAVPGSVRKHYGNQVAAMAEAATRQEFSLIAK